MKEYSGGFTSDGLYKKEIRDVLRLKKQGLSRSEIYQEVLENNVFQMKSESGIQKRFQSVWRRAEVLDDRLRNAFLEGTRFEENALILYGFLATYRLPYEFFMEVIVYNYRTGKSIVRVGDVEAFFERKETESEVVARWSSQTKKRLRQCLFRFLRECGLLIEQESETYLISPLHMQAELKQYAEVKHPLLALLTTVK